MKRSSRSNPIVSSSGSGESEDENHCDSECFQTQRTVKGIAVKHLDFIPFCSTLSAVLDLNAIRLPLSTNESYKLRERMKAKTKALGIHLVHSAGYFDWEKVVLENLEMKNENLLIRSSFTPTFGEEEHLKCIVNVQIKAKRKENRKSIVNELPSSVQVFRRHLMIDLLIILQHQLGVQIIEILKKRHRHRYVKSSQKKHPESAKALPVTISSLFSSIPQRSGNCTQILGSTLTALPSWKSHLTFRDVSFEESDPYTSTLHKCTILPLQKSLWVKGFVFSVEVENKRIPLLWAKYKSRLKNRYHVYEATEGKNLLGIVNSYAFGDRRIYERFRVEEEEVYKEIAAVNYSRVIRRGKKLNDLTLLPREVGLNISELDWKGYKWKRYSENVGQGQDFHVFKIQKVRSRDGEVENENGGNAMRIENEMQIQNESGDVLLRMRKLDGFKHALEYKRPFDAFTAFSIALLQF